MAFLYEIKVETGTRMGAGTNANVSIKLTGTAKILFMIKIAQTGVWRNLRGHLYARYVDFITHVVDRRILGNVPQWLKKTVCKLAVRV